MVREHRGIVPYIPSHSDTNVFVSSKNLNELIININRELTNIDMVSSQ